MTRELFENIRNVKEDEREKLEKSGKAGDMWLPLFMSILAMNNQPNTELEKKVAYLSGKVDVLEKLITDGR